MIWSGFSKEQPQFLPRASEQISEQFAHEKGKHQGKLSRSTTCSSPFQKLGKTFLLHRNVSGEYKAVTNCPITLAVVLGGTTGLLLLIGLGLLAAVIVLVNLNDLRRWQQYQAWLAENERRLHEHRNPLYQEKGEHSTTFQNPAFGTGN